MDQIGRHDESSAVLAFYREPFPRVDDWVEEIPAFDSLVADEGTPENAADFILLVLSNR